MKRADACYLWLSVEKMDLHNMRTVLLIHRKMLWERRKPREERIDEEGESFTIHSPDRLRNNESL